MGLFSWLFNKNKPKKIKIGLALGSGGAKGFAHLGALKAFEENGLEFDIIAGTSIGSVIGAFVAEGYSSTDILELLKRVNFGDIKSMFMLNMDTSGLYGVIDKAIGSKNIEELKKPFRAVATEIESGDAKVFDSGSVALSLCASSSMPPFFKPVVINNDRYVDGAFSNSIPADVVKDLGADYIVGVDLSTRDSKPSLLSKLFPTYEGKVSEPWKKGYDNSDIMIHPNLSGFSATSFSSAEIMYDIGYQTAIELMPKIQGDIEKLKLNGKKNK
jgi:NTE family protein